MKKATNRHNSILAIIAVALVGSGFAGLLLWQQSDTSPNEFEAISVEARDAPTAARKGADTAFQAPRLRFAPEDGQRLAIRFIQKGQLKLNLASLLPGPFAAQAPQTGETDLVTHTAGTLELRFYGSGADAWSVAAQLAKPVHVLNGEAPSYAPQLNYPFVFQMDDRGRISEFEYAKGISPLAAATITRIVSSMQFILPENPERIWTVAESDHTGRYTATYELLGPSKASDGWRVSRKHTGYDELNPDLPVQALRGLATDVSGKAAALLPERGAWFESLEQDTTVRKSIGGRSEQIGSAELRAWREPANMGIEFPEKIAELRGTLRSGKFILAGMYHTVPALDAMAEGLDVEAAVARYQDLLRTSGREFAEKFFVNYLRLHPEASAELIAEFDRQPDQYTKEEQLVLWRLIGEAGIPEAQMAVINAAMDKDNTKTTRIRAMAYVSDFSYPVDSTVRNIWRQYEESGDATPNSLDGDIKAMSILALGVLGRDDKLNDEIKPFIEEKLTSALEDDADSVYDEVVALRAVGNTGNEEFLDEVKPYFTSSNVDVRAASYVALRRMKDPRAQTTLISAVETEKSPKVREAALRTLSEMPTTASTVAWARDLIMKTSNIDQQVILAHYLGQGLDEYPQNEAVLRAVLHLNPAVGVKQAIYTYIAPN
jgi:hypothetical protein